MYGCELSPANLCGDELIRLGCSLRLHLDRLLCLHRLEGDERLYRCLRRRKLSSNRRKRLYPSVCQHFMDFRPLHSHLYPYLPARAPPWTQLTHVAEAQSSLVLLTELCPFFLILKTIAKQDWLEMPPQVAQAPASPSGSSLSSARLSANLFSPSRSSPKSHTLPPAFSPNRGTPRIGGVALSPLEDEEAVVGQAIAGPASPGRVRRVGGLREVRERIRRELGE